MVPDRFSATSGAANRIGKIFVDYLRNGKGQTTAGAFSARARPSTGVSMPISWEQLSGLKSGAHWTVQTAREYLSFHRRPLGSILVDKTVGGVSHKTFGMTYLVQ
ncbi:non-homologous end-joining DNA ligase LigD [Paraburkholderia xenovorans]|uniref:non-homologous end-joining DNA ligase LigD n=1 Tax=Paraburkholderia xenovorans TaxID=36873 RepID=UPI0038BD9A4F